MTLFYSWWDKQQRISLKVWSGVIALFLYASFSFPGVILIDQNTKVLLIGNPHVDLEKIEKIINGEIAKL